MSRLDQHAQDYVEGRKSRPITFNEQCAHVSETLKYVFSFTWDQANKKEREVLNSMRIL